MNDHLITYRLRRGPSLGISAEERTRVMGAMRRMVRRGTGTRKSERRFRLECYDGRDPTPALQSFVRTVLGVASTVRGG